MEQPGGKHSATLQPPLVISTKISQPGGGRGQWTVVRDWNPRGKEVAELVAPALRTCQPLPAAVICRACGQGCKRSTEEKGGIGGRTDLVRDTSDHPAFHKRGSRK